MLTVFNPHVTNSIILIARKHKYSMAINICTTNLKSILLGVVPKGFGIVCIAAMQHRRKI